MMLVGQIRWRPLYACVLVFFLDPALVVNDPYLREYIGIYAC